MNVNNKHRAAGPFSSTQGQPIWPPGGARVAHAHAHARRTGNGWQSSGGERGIPFFGHLSFVGRRVRILVHFVESRKLVSLEQQDRRNNRSDSKKGKDSETAATMPPAD